MPLAPICPQPLVRIPEPFNDPGWIWEPKLDGFRALAYVEKGECRLLSDGRKATEGKADVGAEPTLG